MLEAGASSQGLVAFLGWGAAGLTLGTFACVNGLRLRITAIGANTAFVAYGAMAGLMPVLVLHLALIPINLWRLAGMRRSPAPRGGISADAVQQCRPGARIEAGASKRASISPARPPPNSFGSSRLRRSRRHAPFLPAALVRADGRIRAAHTIWCNPQERADPAGAAQSGVGHAASWKRAA